MARLVPVSWREFVQRLRELGYEGPYAGGRHPQMREVQAGYQSLNVLKIEIGSRSTKPDQALKG